MRKFIRFKKIVGITLLSTLLLAGCGKKNTVAVQEQDVQTVTSDYTLDESNSGASVSSEYGELIGTAEGGEIGVTLTAANPTEFLNALIGVYKYEKCSLDGQDGFIVIENDPEAGGIAIGDYFDAEKQFYRFVGYDFYCTKMEGNRIYMEYPETVYDDDTAVYSYYIFEATNEGISVYFSYDSFDAAQLIYTARKAN